MVYSMFVVIFASIFLSSTTFDVVICGGALRICGSSNSESTDDMQQGHEQGQGNGEQRALASLVTITVHRGGQLLSYCIGVLHKPDIVITIGSCLEYGVQVDVEVSPISSEAWIEHRENTPIRFRYFSGNHKGCLVGPYLFVMQLPQTAVNEDARFPSIPDSQYFRNPRNNHKDGITFIQVTAEADSLCVQTHTVKDEPAGRCWNEFLEMDHRYTLCVKESQPQTVTGSPYFKVNQHGVSILRGLLLGNKKKLGAYATTFELDVGINEVVKALREEPMRCGTMREQVQ